jgi:hypothetical protein
MVHRSRKEQALVIAGVICILISPISESITFPALSFGIGLLIAVNVVSRDN